MSPDLLDIWRRAYSNMKIYLAPMEGITGHTYRSIYRKHFTDADRYFTPFISAHEKHLGKKAINEILPENNAGLNLVPQIMVGNTEEYKELERLIGAYGYNELNINAGCPSGTVVGKARGSGLLKDWARFDDMLEGLFDCVSQENSSTKLSIKTRLGWSDPSEWEKLAQVIGRFPFTEVIIHARVREEFYKGSPHQEALEIAREYINAPIIYNGDIWSVEDAAQLIGKYPWIDGIMVGRGILKNPGLISEIRKELGSQLNENKDVSAGIKSVDQASHNAEVHDFMEELCDTYLDIFKSDVNTLYHMKELWSYLGLSFPDKEKELKKIRKTKSISEYRTLVHMICS